ncbi:MAG TPA: 50S ribosomal protein L4 [Acidobacteria bacterium]|nr:50S ribosomal protein L4 [Acidobacteriota bacterium]HIM15626.1 50S ribosomal protein L4 [Acidobacteriota bacterium]
MTLDVVNEENKKVDSLELSDAVFGGPVATSLIWESVVHEQASRRRGTHATKTRGLVSGTGKKPWRQKGTGRARVGEARNPLWRTGGVVFGPQPRSYAYRLPRKVALGALRAALSQKLQEGSVIVLSELAVAEPKTRKAVELLGGLGVSGKTLLIDVHPDENLLRASSNLPGVQVVSSGRVTARDLIDTRSVIITKSGAEHLVKVLAR